MNDLVANATFRELGGMLFGFVMGMLLGFLLTLRAMPTEALAYWKDRAVHCWSDKP